jgi:hypothetical protein
MKGPQVDHPELLTGPNPLLEAAAPFVTYESLPSALTREPLRGLDWRSVRPEHRTILLKECEQHYWPNRLVLEAADSIQTMLRGGLMMRNPLSVAEQRRMNSLAMADNLPSVPLQSLRVRAGGGIISAITGMGKSTLLERALEVFAPEQVVVHSKSESCGWLSLTQVLYLVIDAPFNGTRGGLLARIVEGLDTLLGTDYCDVLRKFRNQDSSLLFVTRLLSIHRVGLLAIDENQQGNFDQSMWRDSFILFFLGLMNLGIPVLLLGNPLAFVGLESSSQNLRRFATAGHHKLDPAASATDPWWSEDYVPGMYQFLLCDEAPPVVEIVERTFGMSAGVPGLFGPLWIEAQRLGLRRGGERASLTCEDLLAASTTPRVKQLLAIASQVAGGTSLRRFMDIPEVGGMAQGGQHVGPGLAPGQDSLVNQAQPMDPVAETRKILERRERSILREAEKRKEKNDHLSPEDMRIQELKMEQFAGLKGQQGSLFSGCSRAPAKER